MFCDKGQSEEAPGGSWSPLHVHVTRADAHARTSTERRPPAENRVTHRPKSQPVSTVYKFK